jgi:hypothetical protein
MECLLTGQEIVTYFEKQCRTFWSVVPHCAVLYLIVSYDSVLMFILIRISQWHSEFLLRNPEVSLLKSEATKLGRIQRRMSENVENLMEKYKFPGLRVYNMDEIRIYCPD